MTYAKIIGTGSYLPDRVMLNAELEAMVDTSDAWIKERSGISQRHIAAESETTSIMANHAANRALEAAGKTADEVDLIIVATTTPDKVFPSVACMVQRALGIKGCPAFDVQAACSGFTYALDVANRFVQTGGAKCALVIGAETFSRILDWTDRSTCVLFGDGAGAVLLAASDEPGIISSHSHADGEFEELLHVPHGISSGYDVVRAEAAYVHMQGGEVFKRAVSTLGAIANETIVGNGIEKQDVDWLVPHQANLRIIKAAAKKLSMPMERVVVTVDKHANTSSASIPLALDTAVRDGRIKAGDLLLFEAFGAGFTWGSALLRY
ncbi:MAG: ketoacyl-ACP synthase III [Gammaproteobacteria bacterium]|nr:ketoacyl-ACP synthase III [Gammaproteobacteria bacterium]MBT8151576.1 ketoacyl-ACP synthase III [Gammaproteobacteria bacterium]NND39608.1 ketoacyl-ACP synthase III [Pseudomonadales bacterium]NNL10324.1 ketoacyl-ACP synthase III [Pseudomonadales bacterium]RZV51989.1 MAG: ketoacyl-ACP synthase III [Pseudomonadales bacterium]